MAHSCPFGLFLLVLCLVTCVCAYGNVSEHGANEAVKEAKKSANDVFQKAQQEVIDAEYLLSYINTQKSNVEKAVKEAGESANENSEATTIAQKAKSALDGITALYPNALEKANKYIACAKNLKTKAYNLVNDANNLFSSSQSRADYPKIKEDADAIKSRAELLKNNITTASSFFENVPLTKFQFSKFSSEARIVKYQVDVIVAVSKYESLLQSAEKNVKLTGEKKNEIDAIEKKMQDLYNNHPNNLSSSFFSGLSNNVGGSSLTASHASGNAQTALEYIMNLKQTADNALQGVKASTNDENARREVNNAKYVVTEAEKKVKEINKELEKAEVAVRDAISYLKVVENSLNQNTNKQQDTQGKDKQDTPDSTKIHQPMPNKRESTEENEATNHAITNTEKPVSKGKESTEDTKEGPTGSGKIKPTTINSDESMNEQNMENTTEITVVSGTGQPTITKPNKPVSGETDPTRHDQSDSAMTVSATLIVALTAFAALN